MIFVMLIQGAILLGLGAIMFIGALVAFRAERSWATICLLAGTCLMVLGWTCGSALGMWLAYNLSSAHTSGAVLPSGVNLLSTFALVARVIGALGVLSACAGFIGLVMRFAVTERRAGELEALSANLQDQLASQPSAVSSPRG